ncbi:MAG: indole-3-glycerol-phosphate synthase [bacterium]|nr:indole-3-glycerol-phosphate synthase [bacterium]
MNFLQSIAGRKKEEITYMKPITELTQSNLSLIKSLRLKKLSLILEVKPKSPSAGELIDRKNIPSLVEEYNKTAAGISVLCDEIDFGGGYDLLSDVRSMTTLPILAKEFIIDPVQIRMARSCGADAVLLIGALLSKDEVQSLADEAVILGMEVLFEMHNVGDLEKVPSLSPDQLILGINNRDLKTLDIDLSTTEELAPKVRERFPEHLLLSESGVSGQKDIQRLEQYVDGFLIGTAALVSHPLL